MTKRFYLSLIVLLAITFKLSAQSMKGREAAKGTVNLSELSKYLEKHPERYKQKRVISEAEGEYEGEHEDMEIDPSLVRIRPTVARKGTSGGGALMPATSSPADYFLANTSTGTSIPPDTHGGVDSTYAVSANNAQIRVQNKTTHAVLSTTNCDAFWGTTILGGSGFSSFDPRVHYDPYANRWIIVAVSTNGGFTGARILIAVSATGNPTGTWYKYGVNVYNASYGWLDFPNVGFNNKWIVVTGNYFTAGGSSTTAAWFAFNKASLYSNSGAFYGGNTISGFTWCPAQTYDSNESNMFLVTIGSRGSGSTGGTVQLRKITGAVGSPVISGVLGNASASSLPTSVRKWSQNGAGGADFAPQLGSTYKLQTNDDRINNCVFRNGKIWCSHPVFYPQSGPTRSSVMWWQMDSSATPVQVGVIDDPTNVNFYGFPSLAVNTLDDAVIGFSTFSSSIYPSAAYALHLHTDPLDSVRTPFIYRNGQKPYYRTFGGSQNRWGDYSGTCWDPALDNFWTVQESVPAYSGSISASLWDTWWAHITICPTPASPTLASSPTDLCAGTSGTYAITPITGATSYTWTMTAPTTTPAWALGSSTTTSNTLTAGGSGTATVSVTASNGCGPGSALTFTVTAATVPPAPVVDTVVPACVGSTTATFHATAGTATTFSWNASGPGWTGTSSTATFTPTVGSSTGTISVFAANTCGVGATTSFSVPLGTPPGAATAITAPTLMCSGSTATFTTPVVTGATSYTWSVSGTGWSGTSTTASLSATVGTAPGTITVTPVNACGNGTPFTLPAITPTITPTAAFTVSLTSVVPLTPVTVTYTGTPLSATGSYTWSWDGGIATPGTGVGPHSVHWTSSLPVHTKTVTLTVADSGCTSTVATTIVTVNPGVAVSQVSNPKFSASVVPNPSNGTFNFVFDRVITGSVNVVIYDMQGRAVFTNEYSNVGNNKLPVSVSNLAPGNYAVSIQSDGTVISRKLTIEK